jgi:predicted N-acetyltransferase YhbS
MRIRGEDPGDVAAIGRVTAAAFAVAAHSSGTEARIVEALRAANALTLSIVAAGDGDIVGHAAFSPVRIGGIEGAWFGLGPVSVRPDRQRTGVGGAIIRRGLDLLGAMDAEGCVVFGDPAYYGRFGFAYDPRLSYAGAPAGYFQRLVLRGAPPAGEVVYHPAFDTP